MQNQNLSSPSTSEAPSNAGSAGSRTTGSRHRKGRILAVTAVVAIGAITGSGFAMQSAFAAENDRVAATAALTNSTAMHREQLGAYSAVLKARSTLSAVATMSDATATIASASGKADATVLSTSVAKLANYKLLAPERVLALVDETKAGIPTVQAAVAEADRVAAEQAAAAAAAAQAAADAAVAQKSASSSPSTSTGSRPAAPSDPSGAQAIAHDMMAANYGWGDDQFGCLVALWSRESGWNANSYNSSSGAGGIPQALPASKMASAGADWATNPATQIAWGLGYISGRWGTPCAAWDHSESSGWY